MLDEHAIVSVTDIKGRIIYTNDKVSQVSGYSKAELMGQDHHMLNSGHHPQAFFRDMYETIARGEVWHGEVCNRARDGHLYWVAATIAGFVGDDGKLLKYIMVCNDITERKHAADAAHAANRAKSEFLANMSHEIRTPMNGVIGMIDVLQKTELKPEQHRMLAIVNGSSEALLQILNDILDYSKIEVGMLTTESIATDIRAVAEGAAQLMVAIANSKSIEFVLFVSPELPRWIVGDPTRLRQVLLNLLGNAVKFTTHQESRPGLVMLCVNPCSLADGSAGVQLRITDSGIGMNPETVAKLFQPFTQGDEGIARRFGGTGLGLSISQRLIGAMGGRIMVRSTPGAGSEFTIELPLQVAPPAAALAVEPSLAGMHVLAVTCNVVAAHIVQAYSRAAGAEVTVVADLAEARQQLRQSSDPTVLLLGNAITTASEELDLPASVGIVRLVKRSSSAAFKEIMVSTRPLLYRELVNGLAQACGRLTMPELDVQDGNTLLASAASTSIETAEFTGRLILLAEDNAVNCEVMQEQLSMLGYTAEVAEDGEVALEMWRSSDRYGLLMTDCHMPNMDGFALTAAIREAEPEGMRLPIIAITANAMEGEAQHCIECGMDDYLSKPLRLNELGLMLNKWLPLQAGMAEENREAVSDKATEPPAVWDAATLTGLVGDKPAMHRRLLEKFLHSAEEQVGAIAVAAAAGEAGIAADVAHKLKSAARTVGAMQLGELCHEMETAGRMDDVQNCRALAGRLDVVLTAAKIVIRENLEQKAASSIRV